MGPRKSRRELDDIDDFMASLIHKDNLDNPPAKKSALRKKPTLQSKPLPPARNHATRIIAEPASPRSPKPQNDRLNSSLEPKKQARSRTKLVVGLATIAVVTMTGVFGLRGPVASLLSPGQPFSTEQRERMNTPLYYPTKLPGSFKIEVDNIAMPDSGVLIYAISDDQGRQISVTLQTQPNDLTLEPLYAALKNVSSIETKFGNIQIGTTEENTDMVNILAGQTWIIISSKANILKADEIKLIVDSLQKVEPLKD